VTKGLTIVVLDEGPAIIAVLRHITLDSLPDVFRHFQPDVIAIDSPSSFPKAGRRRTERFLTALGLSLHHTPDRDAPSDVFPGPWMAEGLRVFELAARCGYPLFNGKGFDGRAFEVYPYASAVVLDGRMRPAGLSQVKWRRGVLQRAGVDVTPLRGLDHVNAALAALTGLFALSGRAYWEGDPDEGLIVLPCRHSELPSSYRRM
jgi:predicted nuclease with RNAse H fold